MTEIIYDYILNDFRLKDTTTGGGNTSNVSLTTNMFFSVEYMEEVSISNVTSYPLLNIYEVINNDEIRVCSYSSYGQYVFDYSVELNKTTSVLKIRKNTHGNKDIVVAILKNTN